jgi:MFS family permease
MRKKAPTSIIFGSSIIRELALVAGIVMGPTFSRLFDLSKTELGILLGATSMGIIIFSAFVGRITHRRGPVYVFITGILINMGSILFVLTAGGFVMLAAGLTGIGVATAFIANSNVTMLSDIYPERLRKMISLVSASWFMSSAFSSPVIGAWLEFARSNNMGLWSFRVPYIICFVLFSICLWIGKTILEKTIDPVPHSYADRQGFSKAMNEDIKRTRRLWLWAPALGACHGLLIIGMLSWVNPMIQEKFGANEITGALAVAGVAFGVGAGRLVLSSITSGVDERLILAVSGLVGGIVFGSALAAPTTTFALIALTAGGFVCSTTYPCIVALIGNKFPVLKSRLYGYNEASVSMAGLAGPPLVGFIADRGVPLWWAMGIYPLAAWIIAVLSLTWLARERLAEETDRDR